jgi:hypothetical protein
VLLLNAGAIAWFIYQQPGEPDARQPVAEYARPAMPAQATARQSDRVEPRAASPQSVPAVSDTAAPSPVAEQPVTASDDMRPERQTVAANTGPSAVAANDGHAAETRSGEAIQSQETPSREATPRAVSRVEPSVATPDQAAAIPLLMETDFSFQQRVPDISIDVHVYSERSAERFVFINMQKYREGDETREGIMLEKIVQDGVVLSLDGTRFRLLPQ